MDLERWQQIDKLVEAALELEGNKRAAFLERACAGDEGLRREVESLLGMESQARPFLEVPALEAFAGHLAGGAIQMPVGVGAAAKMMAREKPESLLGQQLGSYRIISLLGAGGMGEVFLAQDSRLNRTVALKILPAEMASEPERMRRFVREARAASSLKHPNVATIHEMGESGGLHFIAMEHVEGQTLASKISGRPLETAEIVEIGLQVADALDEAHSKGITHRDIKPINLMLTPRGQVKVLDFGLAKVLHAEGQRTVGSGVSTVVSTETGVVMGTVQYMSPEQLLGKEVDHRTDIFSLGVVLYEMATGRLPFSGATASETADGILHKPPEAIARFNYNVPVELERIVRKCLEKDRERRFQSARELLIDLKAAASDIGNPLAAALSAGETPTPKMVAEAGEVGVLRPLVAWAYLSSVILGLLLIAPLSGKTMLYRRVPMEKPPEVLVERARTIVKKLGYTDRPVDSAYHFEWSDSYLRFVREHDPSADRWERLATSQPGPISFHYRQSPQHLVPLRPPWRVWDSDPPESLPGMVSIGLDPQGRLTNFRAVPAWIDTAKDSWKETDWSSLFAEAGLSLAGFTPVHPSWASPFDSDTRVAWEKTIPGQRKMVIHVNAALYHGKPNFFEIKGPWAQHPQTERFEWGPEQRTKNMTFWVIFILVLLGSIMLARRNLRLGRGDRAGAFKLAVYIFSVILLSRLLWVDHVSPLLEEWNILKDSVGQALYQGVVSWLVYLALEPYVRRYWPHTLISWSRLLAGRFRDPLVGRDVLIGSLFGILLVLLWHFEGLLPAWLGRPAPTPFVVNLDGLNEGRRLASIFLYNQYNAVFTGLFGLFILLLLRVILRRRWLSVSVFGLIETIVFVVLMGSGENRVIGLLIGASQAALATLLLIRFGLLSTSIAWFFYFGLRAYPITLDFSAWYAGRSLFVLLALSAIAVWAFRTALAGRPMLGAATLFEE